MSEGSWYVVHTYSGYENKVKLDIEKTIKNRKLQDQIFEVSVPLEEVTEIKNGVEKEATRKLFPCYVLIRMIMNDETWYVVRNTRGVTGFVGPDSKPVPLTETEMKKLGFAIPGRDSDAADAQSELSVSNAVTQIDFEVGDMIVVNSGAWEGNVADIKSINEKTQSVTIEVEMFGRATPVELKFTEVRKK